MSSAARGVTAIISVVYIYWITTATVVITFPLIQIEKLMYYFVRVCCFRSLWMILKYLEFVQQKKWFAMNITSCTPAATKYLCFILGRAF